jgi:RHS repeat-associated protein
MEGNFTATGYNQKYRYNGKELYGGLGWYDYGARYYDPALGRFTGVDKLADEPEQVDKSPYAYAWNNPIKYDDPEGNCPRCQQYNQLKREVGKLVSFVKEWFSPKTISPVKDPVISSEFVASRRSPIDGKFKPHKGIDIVDKDKNKTAGKDVVSATDGTVVSKTSKDDGNGAGNRIHIKDEDGYKHSYFHLSDNNFGNGIKSGSEVEQGQKIGEIGNTGASKGAHLHYEIRDPKGKPINPREGNKGLKNAPTDEQVRKNN